MNPIRLKSARLRKLVLAQGCALIAVSLATGQQTKPDPVRAAQDAQALAKYDTNKNGTLDASERAAMAADQASASTPAAAEGEVFLLTPFQVDASKDAGYFAENTLAGSRLNTNLSDLAASITVVTKQQMEDTASLDINDIFKYEASTEGSSSYTPSVTDRGALKDTIGGYSLGNNGDTTTNAQSNRVRGLAAPDASINYHPSNSRVPFDSYNTQSVEISRGPNSLLFGMGSPAGIVNQSASQAVLNRDSSSVSLRTDHMGSFRTALTLNRSVIKDKLAVYGAFLYNDQRFEREPAFERTRRQYGAITAKPFPRTIIRAFAENYDNFANRPNFITPRDFVTPWLQAGKPAYDPVTRMITRSNGQPAIGPFYFDTRSPNADPNIRAGTQQLTGAALLTNSFSPYYLQFGIAFDTGNSSPLERFDNGRQIDYFQRTVTFYAPAHTNPATTTPTAATWLANDPRFLISDRNWTGSTGLAAPRPNINGVEYTYGSYQVPGVTNGAIYDWSKINVNEPNFGQLKAGNYNIEIEQQIFDSLFFSAGWFRQDIDSSENYLLSQLQGNTMQIDTNLRLMDGRTNPYFGLPFLPLGSGGGVDTFFAPETDDSYRALLAWDVNFTKQKNIFKWLGRHRFLGLLSEQDVKRSRERWRLGWTDGDAEGKLRYTRNLTLDGQSHWDSTTIRKAFYLASPGDPAATATHSAGFYNNPGWQSPYVAKINAYNFNTNDFHDSTVLEKTSFAHNGSARFQREV
ncbi:MAG TPA: TonB-dependent receptor plug domain-containing protein, partial [Opitutaceae bacterium]|nr:TonB-dependent receptor plug domain-containing protein [Opitutaceae bacterium]